MAISPPFCGFRVDTVQAPGALGTLLNFLQKPCRKLGAEQLSLGESFEDRSDDVFSWQVEAGAVNGEDHQPRIHPRTKSLGKAASVGCSRRPTMVWIDEYVGEGADLLVRPKVETFHPDIAAEQGHRLALVGKPNGGT
ncbi:MAG TPA: hypothetical protein VN578_01100 [Candidatus Binatia bacterium]|jgi:hypothetical protein|nr:hypothetical protein [Candidatus Binatia bacterium]